MGDWIIATDTQFLIWVNSHHADWLDSFMYWISSRVIWIPFYLTLLYATFLSYGWRTVIVMAFMAGLAVGFADQLCATVIRPYVERLRPANPDNPISSLVHIVNDYRGGRFGFPSCHAANTFAAATLTSLLFRRWRFTLAMLLWAVMVSYSRLYLGVHYPGDILTGGIIGFACGTGAYALAGTLIGIFVYKKPHRRESRQIVATWKRGAPMITSRIMGQNIIWRPSQLPIYTLIVTVAVTAIFTML